MTTQSHIYTARDGVRVTVTYHQRPVAPLLCGALLVSLLVALVSLLLAVALVSL